MARRSHLHPDDPPASVYAHRMSRPRTESPTPPLELPRGLVFGASTWLAVSWVVSIGIRPPVQPTSTAYTPAARMLVVAIMLGILIAWPLARLSASKPRRPLMSAFLDMISLMVLTQIVIWPLRLVTTWPVERIMVISLDVISNTLLVGGLLALSGTTRRGASMAMLALLALVVIPPIVALGTPIDPIFSASPLVRIWVLASGGPAPLPPAAWVAGLVTAVVAVLVWMIAGRISGTALADPDGLR